MIQKKNNKMRKSARVLMMSFAFVLAASLAAGSMLEANADQVNNFLNTRTTTTTGGGDYDSFTPDEEYLNSDGSANTSALVEAHREMGIALAEEGTVLLKNKNNSSLPLSTSEKVTLLGYRSTKDNAINGMDIGSPEASSQNVSFREALTEVGFDVNDTVADAYEVVSASTTYTGQVNKLTGTGYYVTEITSANRYNIAEPSITEIAAQAGQAAFDASIEEYSDVGIVVIGRPSSEQADYYTGDNGRDASAFTQSVSGNILSLCDGERDLIEYAKSTFDKVIIVVTTANAMELSELEEDDGIDAILWAGYPGNYGFIGVANILAGNANPSGRLADIYASDSASSPAMVNYGLYLYSNQEQYNLNSNDYYGGAYLIQAEGIYTGYKYYETRYEDSIINPSSNASSSSGTGAYASNSSVWNYSDEVTYSFGYGLSYTTFSQEIKNVEFSADGRTATLTVSVTNEGEVDGKSVVQVYGQSPYTDYDKQYGIEKASVQLLAYEKVYVEAGATETITVEVDMQYLASYDSEGTGSYIMEKSSDYYFALGCNAADGTEGAHAALNNILAAKGYTTADGMDSDGTAKAAWRFSWNYDESLFATSKSGETITNQLEEADYNYFNSNTVTYLSRSDWQGTWPKSYEGLSITSDMLAYLQNSFYTLSTSDDVSDITFGGDGDVNFTDMFGSDFDDDRWAEVISKITLENAVRYTASGNRTFQQLDEIYFLSGSSYVENGSVGIQKTLSQQSDTNAPWYVSTSDENANYYTNTFGSPTLMASCWNKELMYEMGVLWGNDALFVNIPMVWAPSINTHRTPYNGRNGEYYSEDAILSGYTAYNVGAGAISKGLITAIKHFAFNSQETSRNGISTYMTEQAAREGELRGFQIALEGVYNEDGSRTSVLGIMTAYNRIGAVYVGASEGLMQGILRGEWDYNGYVTSDLAQSGSTYMPYVESILAGTTNFDTAITNDTTVWRKTVSEIVSSVQSDADFLTALKQNLHYSLWAFSQSNLANWMTDTTRVVWVWNWWRGAYIGCAIVSGLAIAGGLFMYVYAVGIGPWLDERKKTKTAQAGRREQ